MFFRNLFNGSVKFNLKFEKYFNGNTKCLKGKITPEALMVFVIVIKNFRKDKYNYILIIHIKRNFNPKINKRIYSIPDINPSNKLDFIGSCFSLLSMNGNEP